MYRVTTYVVPWYIEGQCAYRSFDDIDRKAKLVEGFPLELETVQYGDRIRSDEDKR